MSGRELDVAAWAGSSFDGGGAVDLVVFGVAEEGFGASKLFVRKWNFSQGETTQVIAPEGICSQDNSLLS
jgi:hypothetical protein